VGNNAFTSTKVGFEAVYASIPDVHKPHIIHPEDVGRQLQVPPKTFISISLQPTLRHTQNTAILTFSAGTNMHIMISCSLPNHVHFYRLSKRCR